MVYKSCNSFLVGNVSNNNATCSSSLRYCFRYLIEAFLISGGEDDSSSGVGAAAKSSWTGARGLITRELIEAHLPAPTDDVVIFVCGPPGMYESLCGPRDDPELTGVLRDLGYSKDQVIKF